MFARCVCVLSDRGVSEEPITRPEESYQLRYVVACDLETVRIVRPWPEFGHSATVGGQPGVGGGKLHNLISSPYYDDEIGIRHKHIICLKA